MTYLKNTSKFLFFFWFSVSLNHYIKNNKNLRIVQSKYIRNNSVITLLSYGISPGQPNKKSTFLLLLLLRPWSSSLLFACRYNTFKVNIIMWVSSWGRGQRTFYSYILVRPFEWDDICRFFLLWLFGELWMDRRC